MVWEDNRNGNWDIYMKDLDTGVEQQVSSSPGDDRVADISGDIVVWQSLVGGVADIRMKNLATGIESPVTSDAAYQNSPRISGDLVVWEDYRNGNWDLYMKDLTSGVESPLAVGASTAARPAVDRDKVVYEDTTGINYDVWMNIVPDVTPPVVSNQSPAGDSLTGCASPVISADLSDNRVGVDTQSVAMTLDSQDVTADATVSDSHVSYQPGEALTAGVHSVTLSVADLSGNRVESDWQFTVTAPELHLNSGAAKWATYEDYRNGLLTVPYQIDNTSADMPVVDVEILASMTTAGVLLSSEVPAVVGDIGPGGHATFSLRYLVPNGTGGFKTTIFAGIGDACGGTRYLPGPPPGW